MDKTITLNVLGGSAVIEGPDGRALNINKYDHIILTFKVQQIIKPFWARLIPGLIKTELKFTGFDK